MLETMSLPRAQQGHNRSFTDTAEKEGFRESSMWRRRKKRRIHPPGRGAGRQWSNSACWPGAESSRVIVSTGMPENLGRRPCLQVSGRRRNHVASDSET